MLFTAMSSPPSWATTSATIGIDLRRRRGVRHHGTARPPSASISATTAAACVVADVVHRHGGARPGQPPGDLARRCRRPAPVTSAAFPARSISMLTALPALKGRSQGSPPNAARSPL